MKIKHFMFILFSISALNLTGCTVEADRIYTICKYTEDSVYCYKNSENFYEVQEDGNLFKVSGVGLRDKPALVLRPSEGSYNFVYELPGLYKGTLTSVNHYINKLLQYGCTYNISNADSNIIEVFIESENYSVRLIFNIRGDIRIYAIDNSGNPILPPYINEK